MDNPVKISHRIFNEFGEASRMEYDANIIKQLWLNTDRIAIIKTDYTGRVSGDLVRMIVVSDQESDFIVQVMDYIGEADKGSINTLDASTLTLYSPVIIFDDIEDLKGMDFTNSPSYAFIDNVAAQTLGGRLNDGPCAVYRQYRSKQLLLDIPLYSTHNRDNDDPYVVLKVRNLLGEEISYKVFILEVL